MSNFPHLPLPLKIVGPAYLRGFGSQSIRTIQNRQNRDQHGNGLKTSVQSNLQRWSEIKQEREEAGLPAPPEGIPVFLQVDTKSLSLDTLRSFGIHVISENEDGYIVGASVDNFTSLSTKIERFLEGAESSRQDRNQAAQLWQIIEGYSWRPEQVLSPDLLSKWGVIELEELYILDLGIACQIYVPESPADDASEQTIQRRERQIREAEVKRDELAMNLEDKLQEYLDQYEGELLSGFIDFNDSFCCRIKINGRGLKDLVLTYSYLFDVSEPNLLQGVPISSGESSRANCELVPLPPDPDSPKICVIDSGIQEGHLLLSPAIVREASMSFVPTEIGTADLVPDGGHGTRVAGAILYPYGPSLDGEYKLPFWIFNAKILDSSASFPETKMPAEVTNDVVERYHGEYGVRLFNLSVAERAPYRTKHMSPWAGEIDNLTFKKDILFIIAAGNLSRASNDSLLPGIQDYLTSGNIYPNYLLEDGCKIANPAHSLNSITVGSICFEQFIESSSDRRSFGNLGELSSFSRTGLGIWDTLKPDVVEYGGDFLYDSSHNLSNCEETSPLLVCSTLDGQSALRKDKVGTSFTAPKVSYILGEIQRVLPSYSALLYRALLVQSAQWPEVAEGAREALQNLRFYGYGIPDVERATRNTDYRVTLFAENQIAAKEAYIYTVPVPESLRNPATNHRIRIEVTLSYKALPRLTRRKIKSYLSTWLHWESSKFDEPYSNFRARILRSLQEDSAEDQRAASASQFRSIPWVIGRQVNSGTSDVRLINSTLQKDWTDVNSFELPDEISFAVVAHAGWQKDLKFKVPYAIVVSFTALDEDLEIYDEIRQEIEIQQQINVNEA
ncbi:S8 family peptidase [Pontibacter ruber]|uniref:S8 family peptidase n=1 Tax=Pontibacter ruber TaxID=1343895 RepID=A0ABW5D1Q1_9BACT|nr:S8 family peptidase [Pontibacter ruber]